ncbi:ATP-binding protein [Faecalicatena orotica]|uniref:Sensor histidine kinase YesM n=1 Tax=Faecalicatena orotica TaxID=1544 RepID=A0A2Y9BCR8_9FIRM|nr:sensor histidine kinase [Faecalicatena orotica]PWJ29267.1 sensor histidine kinase YesM [Faecalicatena orotica]SSA55720.1 Sensor histidine kinase YesM [Faecalicatena orotica]
MILALDILAEIFTWLYGFVFYWIIGTFLPTRRHTVIKIAAFFVCSYIAKTVIYANDLINLFGALIALFLYLLVFHTGSFVEKFSVLLVFYPAMIAVNYLTLNMGTRLFFGITNAKSDTAFSPEVLLISTLIHVVEVLLRLLFWTGAWMITKKLLRGITLDLGTRMWLFVDILLSAPFVAVFTTILFMPEQVISIYPICGASIFTSFGCIYLTSYICRTMKLEFHAHELELKHSYYEDKLKEEERIRRIYHDLKNHLLVLQSASSCTPETQQSIQELRSQIEGYENYYHTGNPYLDILLRDKARSAQENQIDFSALVHFKDGTFIEPLDISTIFGNALDNAIEASILLPPEKRLITLKADRIRDMLSIHVENNITADMKMPERTSKTDSLVHGFGLTNIKTAVEKYEGQCITQIMNETFHLKIVIPVS